MHWSWTPARVLRHIDEREAIVLIARQEHDMAGFAIMYFGEEKAHLNLLAVAPPWRRQRIGRRMVEWLSASAEVAGIQSLELELREGNRGARAFYESLGFVANGVRAGYYDGREAALKMRRSPCHER